MGVNMEDTDSYNGSKAVRKLYDMDIDEISLVKRSANKHATIAFSKSVAPEVDMTVLFDTDGYSVDEEELVDGELVYDESGNEYEFSDGSDGDIDKAWYNPKDVYRAGASKLARRKAARAQDLGDMSGPKGQTTSRNPNKWRNPLGDTTRGDAIRGGRTFSQRVDDAVARGKFQGGRAVNAMKEHPYRTAAGAGVLGVGAGAGGYALTKSDDSYSLGDAVLEELSKSAGDDERDLVIAAAVEEAEFAKNMALEAQADADYERDIRVTEAFIAKAAGYNVPVDPEILGPILKNAAESLSDDELDVLDALFESVGDTLYSEIGVVGGGDNSSIMDNVDAASMELIGKSDMSQEAVTSAVFEANPEAYEQYLSENGSL